MAKQKQQRTMFVSSPQDDDEILSEESLEAAEKAVNDSVAKWERSVELLERDLARAKSTLAARRLETKAPERLVAVRRLVDVDAT